MDLASALRMLQTRRRSSAEDGESFTPMPAAPAEQAEQGPEPDRLALTVRLRFADGAAGASAGPAFYLNNNPGFSAPNANFGGPGFALPAIAPITATSQLRELDSMCAPARLCSVQWSRRAPLAEMERASRLPIRIFRAARRSSLSITSACSARSPNNLVVSVNYVGSQSHFIAGAGSIRGLYAGQLDPKWLALGSNLSKPATAANIAAAQAATGLTLPIPYPGYTAAAAVNSNATIQHMLTWKPQYSGTTDTWGTNVANANYNAFQLSVSQRASHGLTLNINYTYSQNIDNAGTMRSGFAIPAAFTSAGVAFPQRSHRPVQQHQQPATEPEHLWRLRFSVRQGQDRRRPLPRSRVAWRMAEFGDLPVFLRYSSGACGHLQCHSECRAGHLHAGRKSELRGICPSKWRLG